MIKPDFYDVNNAKYHEKKPISEGYFISFNITSNPLKNAMVLVKANQDGTHKIISVLQHSEKVEQIYKMIMEGKVVD